MNILKVCCGWASKLKILLIINFGCASQKLFGEVWSWAGMVREKDHELANPDFSPPHGIWPN